MGSWFLTDKNKQNKWKQGGRREGEEEEGRKGENKNQTPNQSQTILRIFSKKVLNLIKTTTETNYVPCRKKKNTIAIIAKNTELHCLKHNINRY